MSLSGTFDVFSLPEVLRMLATGGKSGTLTVEAAGRLARVEIYEGECCGAGQGGADAARREPDPAGLHACLLDVAFDTVARPTARSASPATNTPARGRPPAPRSSRCSTNSTSSSAWPDIATVVPSTDAIPVLLPSFPPTRSP